MFIIVYKYKISLIKKSVIGKVAKGKGRASGVPDVKCFPDEIPRKTSPF